MTTKKKKKSEFKLSFDFEQFFASEPSEEAVENLKNHLKYMKDKVAYILAKYPYARDNLFYCILMFVREFVPELSKYIDYIPPEVIKNVPSFETIRRVRAKIQNELKMFQPSPKVKRRRQKLAKIWRKAIVQV